MGWALLTVSLMMLSYFVGFVRGARAYKRYLHRSVRRMFAEALSQSGKGDR